MKSNSIHAETFLLSREKGNTTTTCATIFTLMQHCDTQRNVLPSSFKKMALLSSVIIANQSASINVT